MLAGSVLICIISILFFLFFLCKDLFLVYPADHGGFIAQCWHYVTVKPWVGFITVTGIFHATWVTLLLASQMFQVNVHLFLFVPHLSTGFWCSSSVRA